MTKDLVIEEINYSNNNNNKAHLLFSRNSLKALYAFKKALYAFKQPAAV